MIDYSPLVSVVIPCYNAQDYVEDAVRSIMMQSYTNLEIIVINDGSLDLTKDILLNLASQDHRIRYVENAHNLKLIKTLNLGISIAKGKYIARMDADDISNLNRIKIQIDFFRNNQEVSILGSSVFAFKGNNIISGKIVKQPLNDLEIKSKMFVASALHHPTVMFNTLKINKSEIFYNDEFYRVEDYELWMRLIIKGHIFANINEPLLKYRILKNSEARMLLKNIEEKNEILNKLFKYFFHQLDFKLTNQEIEKYVFTLNRRNFKNIKLKEVNLLFKKILSANTYFNLKDNFSMRWIAILFYGDKRDLLNNIFMVFFSKFTMNGFLLFLRK